MFDIICYLEIISELYSVNFGTFFCPFPGQYVLNIKYLVGIIVVKYCTTTANVVLKRFLDIIEHKQ